MLQALVSSILGGMLGVRGFVGDQLHLDFVAFRSGLRDCFDESGEVSRGVSVAHSRSFRPILTQFSSGQPNICEN
jgi:hypothetical protein